MTWEPNGQQNPNWYSAPQADVIYRVLIPTQGPCRHILGCSDADTVESLNPTPTVWHLGLAVLELRSRQGES